MSDDKIIQFPGVDSAVGHLPVRNDLVCPAHQVFTGAMDADINRVVVIGITNSGDFYFAANDRQLADVLMLLKRAEMMTMRTETGEC